MRSLRLLLVLAFMTALGACETGWSLEGKLRLGDLRGADRQLLVLLLESPTAEEDGLPGVGAGSILTVLRTDDRIPSDERIPFRHFAFGCGFGTHFQIVAWAPADRRVTADVGGFLDHAAFAPRPGDLLGKTSRLKKTDCGLYGTQEVSLSLDARDVVRAREAPAP